MNRCLEPLINKYKLKKKVKFHLYNNNQNKFTNKQCKGNYIRFKPQLVKFLSVLYIKLKQAK